MILSLKKVLTLVAVLLFASVLHAQDTLKKPAPLAAPILETPKSSSVVDSIKPAPTANIIKTDTTKKTFIDTVKKPVIINVKPVNIDSLNRLANDRTKKKLDSLKVSDLKTDTVKVKPITVITTPTVPLVKSDNKVSIKTGWALSFKAGTLGLGGEIVKELGRRFSVRAGANYYPFEYKLKLSKFIDEGDANVDINLQLLNYSLFADWYFLKNMHLSGGLVYNLNKITIEGTPNQDIKIGNYLITPAEAGTLKITLASNKITPYVGLGFGRAISHNKRLSFNTDLGVLFTGGPKVQEFTATGLIGPTGSKENADKIESNMKGYNTYPVLSFQLSYKFIK